VNLTFDLVTSKCLGVIYWPWPNFLLSRVTVTHKLSRYWVETVFALNAFVTLTFDLVTSKCLGVIYWPWPNFLLSRVTVTHKLSRYWGDMVLHKMLLWPWPLTYWPQHLKGSSTDHEQSSYYVPWLTLITFSRYWADIMWLTDLRTDRQTDRRTDGRTPYNNTSEVSLVKGTWQTLQKGFTIV